MDSINHETFKNDLKVYKEKVNKQDKYCNFIIKLVANYFNIEESALTKSSKENSFKRRVAKYLCYIEGISPLIIRKNFNIIGIPVAWEYDSLRYMQEHKIKEDEKFRQEVCKIKEILKKSKEKSNGEF